MLIEYDDPRCGHCRYWHGKREDPEAIGECRINSPKVVGVVPQQTLQGTVQPRAMTCFPNVGIQQWCGEYTPMPTKPKHLGQIERTK